MSAHLDIPGIMMVAVSVAMVLMKLSNVKRTIYIFKVAIV